MSHTQSIPFPDRGNLADAACPQKEIEAFMALQAEGKTKEQVDLLKKHRKALLDTIHEGQRALDCLDFLLFKMKDAGGKSKP